jgi:VCBS repeat-containing protein
LFTSSQPADCQLNTGGNSAPVANDDAYVAFENVVLNVLAAEGVLANDTDADNDTLTAQLIANAINGSVALNADGSFTYSPTPATCGPDSFTYRASDGQALSAAAVVSLNVTCDFDPDAIFANGFED